MCWNYCWADTQAHLLIASRKLESVYLPPGITTQILAEAICYIKFEENFDGLTR